MQLYLLWLFPLNKALNMCVFFLYNIPFISHKVTGLCLKLPDLFNSTMTCTSNLALGNMKIKHVLLIVPAVMSSFWFYTDTFGTFEDDLTLLEAKFQNVLSGSITLWYSTLKQRTMQFTTLTIIFTVLSEITSSWWTLSQELYGNQFLSHPCLWTNITLPSFLASISNTDGVLYTRS